MYLYYIEEMVSPVHGGNPYPVRRARISVPDRLSEQKITKLKQLFCMDPSWGKVTRVDT